MDQNNIVDSELQKAIDEITKTTSVDPTFSDPVAAPSTLPEDADSEPIVPVGPFPEPEAAFDYSTISDPILTSVPEPKKPAEEKKEPKPEAPKPDKALGIKQVKDYALRDLLPLLDNLKITPSQKFNLCRNAFENLKDYSALEPAYRAAKAIQDESDRAEALLYLVESIDKIA